MFAGNHWSVYVDLVVTESVNTDSHHPVLHCTVLYVLYCTALYCTYCAVCTVMYILYCTYCTVCTVLYCVCYNCVEHILHFTLNIVNIVTQIQNVFPDIVYIVKHTLLYICVYVYICIEIQTFEYINTVLYCTVL